MCEETASTLLTEYNNLNKENDNIYRGFAKRMGLSDGKFWVLYILRAEYAPPVQSEICACLFQPKQTINSALKKLEAEGCISMAQGEDRRSKRISLTPRGVALCERTVDRVIAMEQAAFAALSGEEQTLFLSLFRKYTESLKGQMRKNLGEL